MNARDRILAKLRSTAPAATRAAPDIAAYYFGRPPTELAERVRNFKAQMEGAHAEVVIAAADAWAETAAELLVAKGVRRLLLDAENEYGAALVAALPPGMTSVAFERPIGHWKSELFETIDAGFTVAEAGIAATGTLVVSSGPRSPRSTSLVPPLHVALLRAESLYPDLHAAAQGERWSAGMPTNLVLVSGPSKTSDIQQTVAYGAHGPRELAVVIVLPDLIGGGPR
jgi:L-lactate dehydrogenase complex protein LldG